MTNAAQTPKPPRAPRGYVVLVALLILVVITTIVAGQLDTASNELIVGVHAEEEVAARGAAEGCLALMTRYAEAFMCGPPPTPPCQPDFDALLDRNNNLVADGEDYLPSIGTAVFVNGSTQSQAWKFINRGGDSACLVRFDDNSDDAVPAGGLPIGGVDAAGVETDASRTADNLRDVPYLDRDRAIFISAIGLYPYRAATGAAGAYRAAHARVTLRRLYAVSNPQVVGSSGVTANNIVVNNNATVCGVGGMSASTINVGTNGCYCGVVSVDTLTGTIGTGGCGACASCNATSVVDPGPIPPPTVEIPAWSNNFMHAEGWGAPVDYDTPTPNPAPTGPLTDGGETPFAGAALGLTGPEDSSVCSFRGRVINVGGNLYPHLYVWDAKNTDAVASVLGLGPTSFTIGGTEMVGNLAPPTANCTSSAESLSGGIVKESCEWNPATNTVTCLAGQSPCWKLIGRYGDGTTDIGIGAVAVSEGQDGGFSPNSGADIPNVAGNQRWSAAAAGTRLCGGATGGIPNYCSSCNGANEFLDWTGSDHWHFEDGGGTLSRNSALPGPAIFALTSDPGERIHLKSGGSLASPLHMTVLSDQWLDFDTGMNICGARLLCGSVTGAFTQAEADAVHRLPLGPGETMGHSRGFALKSTNLCSLSNSPNLWGDVRCGTVNTGNSFNMIGNLGAYDNGVAGGGTSGPCNTGGTCGNAFLCINNAPNIVGNVAVVGDAELNNTGTMTGRLFVRGSICGNNSFTLTGAAIATGTFEMNNTLTIIVNGDMTVGGTSTFFSPGATSYMEASW